MGSSKKPASTINLQERDIALLAGLFESRVMTKDHIASLFFDGRAEYTKKRLQKLSASGHIGQRPRLISEPAVHFLKEDGFKPLQQHGILQRYPKLDLQTLIRRAQVSPSTIPHELAVMDVKVAVSRAIPTVPHFSLAEFTTWPLLNEFEAWGEIQKPDGFIRIREKEPDGGLSEHAFFLELDRSTERLDVLCRKAATYLDYYKSGGFAERCGGKRSDAQNYPFRVLMVCKSAERRNNIAERLVQGTPPILTHVWLTSLDEIKAAPFGPVWIQPVDYRDALIGSPFEENTRRIRPEYQRQSLREEFVEKTVKKRRLIDAGLP